MRVALAAVNLFAWIFIFQYFFARGSDLSVALVQTICLYVLSQGVTLLVTPWSAKRLRNGVVAPMAQGVLLAAAAYLFLAASFSDVLGMYVIFGILAFALLRGLYRALYWVPYQIDASHGGVEKNPTHVVREIIVAFMPAVCGLILTNGLSGLRLILVGAATLLIFSILLLRRIPNTQEGYVWGYVESFRKLMIRRHRTMVLIAFFDGISGAALLFFWPLAVFLIVGWSYPMLGIVMSATYLIVFFTRTYVRSILRTARLDQSALVHALLAASSWILRLVVSTPLGVILVDSYFYTGTQVRGTGIDVLTFEQSADKGSYVDEYTTLKEMSLALGKIAVCLIGVLFAVTISLPLTFIGVFVIAAIASGVSVFLTRRSNAI
ncbi:MAG: hypothetical protein Q8R25_02195 [bacterium]|nr:hypothetical protein [bacterium]